MKPTLDKFLKHFLFVGGDSYSWKGTLYYIAEDPNMFSNNQTSVYQANIPNNEDKGMVIHSLVYRENNGKIPVSADCEVEVLYSDGELRTVIAGNVSWKKCSGVFIRHWRPSLSYVSNISMKPRYKMMWSLGEGDCDKCCFIDSFHCIGMACSVHNRRDNREVYFIKLN